MVRKENYARHQQENDEYFRKMYDTDDRSREWWQNHLKTNRVKFLVTDPCYVIDDDLWHNFLDECSYSNKNGDHTYMLEMAKYPRQEGVHKMLMATSIPWGDIAFGWGDQSFGADSGSICICEVPYDYDLKESSRSGWGVVVDSLEEAQDIVKHAVAFEFNPFEESEDDTQVHSYL